MAELNPVDQNPLSIQDPTGLPFGQPDQNPPGNFDFMPPSSGPPVPQSAILNRAARVDFALGDKSPGVPSIIDSMRTGDEGRLRQQAMLDEQADFVQHKHDMTMSLIKDSPQGINPDEADFVNNLSLTDFKNYRNKDTILEQKYGEQVVRSVYSSDPNQTLSKAEAINAEAAHQGMDITENEATKQEILKSEVEQVNDDLSKQGIFSKALDIGADMIPFYGSFYLTNLVRRAPLTSLLPGDNLLEQITYLRSIADPNEFQKTLHAAVSSIGNLQEREFFVNAVGAYSISDQALGNLGGLADIGTGAELGVKAAMKGLGMASIKIASKIIPDTGQAARVAGNTEAAASISALRILHDIPLRDQQTIEQKAWSIFNPTNWLTGDGADLTRTNVNKFSDMVDKNASAIKDALFNSPSVDRTSDAVRQELIPSLYRNIAGSGIDGFDNAVLDVNQEGKFVPRTPKESKVTSELKEDTDLPKQPYKSQTTVTLNGVTKQNIIDADGKSFIYDVTGDANAAHRATAPNAMKASGRQVDNEIKSFPEEKEGTRKAIDIQHNVLTNTDTMSVRLGKTNGEQFSNKLSAQRFAKDYLGNHQLGPENFVNQDGKWHVRLDIDLPDNQDTRLGVGGLEDYKNIIPEQDRISTSYLNRFIGNFRNQSNVLGEGISQARKVVAHGNQKLFDTFQKITKPIADLSSKERTKLSAILEQNRDYVDYTDPGNPKRGQFYKSLGEFQSAYHDKWNSLPSDKQTRAYYAYIQANQMDGMIRNAGWLRDNIRLGLKDWSDKVPGGDFNFRGKAVTAIDTERSKDKIHIAVKNSETGEIHYMYDKDNLSDAQKGILKKEIDNNAIIVTPERGTVKVPGHEDKPGVTYYVSGTPKESRLSIDTAWKDGGHVINDHRFYIKQPQIEDGFFKKDLAFATAPNELVAKQRATAIETARQMMLRNDPDLDSFVSKNIGNGFDGNAFKSNFFKGGFDPNLPFYHTPSGIQTVDYHKMEGVAPVKRHPYDQRQLDRAFAGERDPTNIPALIDEKDVKHIFQDGKLLDPFPALARAAKSMVDVKLKRDYILKAANLWSDQFKDLLKPTDSQIGRDPMGQLYHPEYREHGDSDLKVMADNARKNILGFAGMRTKMDTAFDSFSSRMEQIAYSSLGDKANGVVSAYLAPLLRNPIQAAKSTAATIKLGLFSPAQFFMQAQSLTTVLSVSPRAGLKASMVYFPMRYALNSEVLGEHSVGMARLMGWNGDHFREMMDGLKRSGWGFVHGDQAILDAITAPKIFQGKLGKAVDAGNIFLTEGVRAHRLPAYGAAYLEWRAANPGEKFGRAAEHTVLSRADDLSNSMSAANNAVWQKGLIGVPAQFMTFPMRLAEAYFSKTFTTAEKLRMFAGYSMMYGIPTAAAGAVGVWPIYESVKNYLLENNIPHEDNAVQAVLNGLPQTMIKMATGSNIDYGKRFGEGGVSEFRDAIYSNKPLWELATGAVGSVTGDILSSSWPALKGIWSALTDNPKNRVYPLDIQDIMHVFQNITSVNAATKLVYAMNTHRWMSKYDQPMDGVTNSEAFMMALTGANLESIDEVYNTKEVLKGRHDNDSQTMIKMADLYNRGLLCGDGIQCQQYFTQAKALAVVNGLPYDKWNAVMKQVFVNQDIDQVDKSMRRLEEDSHKRDITRGFH